MADQDVMIFVMAKDECSRIFGNVAKSAQQMGEKVENVGEASKKAATDAGTLTKATDLLKGALTAAAVVGAAKAIYGLGQVGATALATQRAFTNLRGSTWEAGKTLGELQHASDGVITKQGLMQAAIKMTQLGFAGTREEMGDVVKTAVTLGDAMGVDAAQSIEMLTNAVTRGRVTALIPLGVNIGQVAERSRELMLENVGMTKQTADLRAVMEQASDTAERLGDSFDNEADTFDRFEAQLEDTKTALTMKVTPAVAGFLGLMNTGMDEAGQWGTRLKQLGVGLYSVVSSDEATLRLADAWDLLEEKAPPAIGAIRDLGVAGGAAALGLDKMTVAGDAAALAQEGLSTSMGDVVKRIGEFEFDNESLWNLALASGASNESLMILADTLGIASQSEIRANIEMQGLIEKFAAGTISAFELKQGLAELRGEVEEARKSAEGFTTALSHIPRDIQVRLNMTGAGAAEAPATMTAAEQARQRAGAAGGAAEAATIREQAITNRGTGAPELQHGTSFHPGGVAMVGEAGPEAVFLPRGAQVHPAHSTVSKSYADNRNWSITVNDRMAAAMLIEQSRQSKLSRLNATM